MTLDVCCSIFNGDSISLILSVDDHFEEAYAMLCISLLSFVMMIKFIFSRYLSVDLDECPICFLVFVLILGTFMKF